MNPVLKYSLLLRLAATPLLFATRHNILYTVLMLIFLDIIDCNPIVVKLFDAKYKSQGCSKDATYQILDKVLDIFQYLVAAFLLRPILPKSIFNVTLLLILYRILGIGAYLYTGNNRVFELFIDFIKEYLALYAFVGSPSAPILVPAVLLKVGYEYLMHDQHIFLTLYRTIFE